MTSVRGGLLPGPDQNYDTLDHVGSATESGAGGELGGLLVRLFSADAPTTPSALWRLDEFDEVVLGRPSRQGAGPASDGLTIEVDDLYTSTRHLVLTREGARWSVTDAGSKNGTFVDGRKLEPGQPLALRAEALLEVGHTFFLFRAGARGDRETPVVIAPAKGAEPSTFNPEWALELDRIDRLAATRHSVLIMGESGVGKEVLAHRLHDGSSRSGPLVAVNCAALAENLLDDELFGHVRGAFSDAKGDRQGLIRAAHTGTLFLDEVEEMPAALQGKLLRVLEDNTVRPIGSEATTRVDVRVLAAANRDLRAMVAERTFRVDLLARLASVLVRIPSVRHRREDLGLLIRAILGAQLEQVRFDLPAARLLLMHRWPLNVRELKQALLVALDLASGEGEPVVIKARHIPSALRGVEAPDAVAQPEPSRRPPTRKLSEEDERLKGQLLELLERHSGNVTAVARELQRPRSNVQRLMARLEVDRGWPAAGRPE